MNYFSNMVIPSQGTIMLDVFNSIHLIGLFTFMKYIFDNFFFTEKKCDSQQILSSTTREVFYSGGFPENYLNNCNQSWLINFTGPIELKFHFFSTEKNFDFVSVRFRIRKYELLSVSSFNQF